MKCLRCDIEMSKEKISTTGIQMYTEFKKKQGYADYQEPIVIKSVNICKECGNIELNIKE